MATGYRISELARRSGFSASTLRYYETVGLLPDPERTDSGYRSYDDTALERLAFIARAKAMGLSLAEVAELVALWTDGPCPPARDRLRALLEGKVAEVRTRQGQLTTLSAQLDHLLRSLAAADPADRCGPGCPCDVDLPPPPAGCTLPSPAAADRAAQWADLAARSTERTPTPDGLRIRLPADPVVVARAAELAVLEAGCCAFFTFTLVIDAAGAWLDVAAPADARPLLEALV